MSLIYRVAEKPHLHPGETREVLKRIEVYHGTQKVGEIQKVKHWERLMSDGGYGRIQAGMRHDFTEFQLHRGPTVNAGGRNSTRIGGAMWTERDAKVAAMLHFAPLQALPTPGRSGPLPIPTTAPTAPASGGSVAHKGYSYTNKHGKVVNVKPHVQKRI